MMYQQPQTELIEVNPSNTICVSIESETPAEPGTHTD